MTPTALGSSAALFAPLQAAVATENKERGWDINDPWHHRLVVSETAESVDIEYQGECELLSSDCRILHDILCLLASPVIAPKLRSFTFRTEAVVAANGVCDYDIDPLVESEQQFPNLTRLSLDQGRGEHGYKILRSQRSKAFRNENDRYFGECGVLARMLEKAPSLKQLISPVPPNADFFCGAAHGLEVLDVDSGAGHIEFIRNLAVSSRFSDLRTLVFTDYRWYVFDDWRAHTTPFEDFDLLFQSPVAHRLERICLRDVNLTNLQIQKLLAIRSQGVEIFRHKVPDYY